MAPLTQFILTGNVTTTTAAGATIELLPVWGSVAQVLVAFGIAEAAVGARRTLTVAVLAHCIGTLAGRYFVWYAPAFVGGLPTSWRYPLDTGPSAATCGVAVYVAIVLGCPRLGGLTVIAVVAAFTLHPDLAGREHLAALAVGAAAAGVQLLMFRRDAPPRDQPRGNHSRRRRPCLSPPRLP